MNQEMDWQIEYERLLNHLRDGNRLLAFWMEGVSRQTIDEAIRRGDVMREGVSYLLASPQLLARLQAEEAQVQTSDENLNKPEIEQTTGEASIENDDEPLQDRRLSPRAFAAEWLRELLQEPRWVEDILRLTEENGIAFTTLKRAKKSIGAKSVKIGGYFGGEDTRWLWRLD